MALANYIATIRDLIPGLMGGTTPTVPPGRSGSTIVRQALVTDGALTTFVVPGDFPEHTDGWFAPGETRYPPSPDNEFEYFRDARQAYPAMKEAMETARADGHFILLIGWSIYHLFDILHASRDQSDHAERARRPPIGSGIEPPVEHETDRTLDAIFRRKVSEGVMVRVLMWSQPFARQNDPSSAPGLVATALQLLIPQGDGDAMQAAVDGWAPLSPRLVMRVDPDTHRPWGAQHQKILLVNGDQGLIGFYGGMDFHPDRVETVPDGAPQHDVHARVRGPAADHLLTLARERWDMSFPVQGTVHGVPDGRYLSDLPATAPLPATREPRVRVQLGHTVGNPHILDDGWTSNGWSMIQSAIQRAQRFIYLEDQYLFSEAAVTELAAAIPRLAHLTILIPGDRFQAVICELRHWALRRLLALTPAAHHGKIGVYERKGTTGAYVHSKTWIFDDELAIVGSSNCNKRGYLSDSEVIGLSSDLDWSDATGRRGGLWHRLELDTAHSLRMRLWEKHLGVLPEVVHDGVASAYLWRRPEHVAQVEEYRPLDGGRSVPWRTFVPGRPDAGSTALGQIIDPPLPPPRP